MSKKFRNKVKGAVETVETKVVAPVAEKAEEVKESGKGTLKKVLLIGGGIAGGLAVAGIAFKKLVLDKKSEEATDVAIEDDAEVIDSDFEEVNTTES